MKLQGLRSPPGPGWLLHPSRGRGVSPGGCSLHGQPHAKEDGRARRQYGFGAQRPGPRSVRRAFEQHHGGSEVPPLCASDAGGPTVSDGGRGAKVSWTGQANGWTEGLPLHRAAQDRDTCSGHGVTGATGPPCAGLQNATTHMPTPDVGGRWPTAIVPRHRRCREAFATTRRPRRRR